MSRADGVILPKSPQRGWYEKTNEIYVHWLTLAVSISKVDIN